MFLIRAVIFFTFTTAVLSQKSPNFWAGRDTIVHLFEWKWKDIANECERFLKFKGYGGVQVSPPSENLIIKDRPWYERYQPVSYKLITRSGNENDFLNMTTRCNAVGIRIYADAVINHMSGGVGIGTGGSLAEPHNYPAVPYTKEHFHEVCSIQNYQDQNNVRKCELVGLADLDQSKEYVRQKIANYMNHLIDLGVAGFRIDAAKHMDPSDLENIYTRLKNLNTKFGFEERARPFIFQEVIDYGNEAIKAKEYINMGRVVEFKYGRELSRVFSRNDKLKWLINFGPDWNLLNSSDALAFIDNHDNQRESHDTVLTHKRSKEYKMAVAFMLSWPYGVTRIMSSFYFNKFEQGPPCDESMNILSPEIQPDDTCSNGWVCEHRWRQIYNMVIFRNVVNNEQVTNWWNDGEGQQIAFSRGNKGFIAFTNFGDINREFQTGLPKGTYCDIISGNIDNGRCTGKMIEVKDGGKALINLGALEYDGVLAIHLKSKL